MRKENLEHEACWSLCILIEGNKLCFFLIWLRVLGYLAKHGPSL